ncbi:hypothetical protein [Arthrobacter sp. H14-L1]|uniref:hypothetical protein n=1 Tax=Arthrobacter sp. H14-L1 TaxID=2996697 RepID=UPI0022706C23|nr:hypothetical protein [Arthrobacter sp. H14-L1]MCY0905457.1 hypothetical protein [Arthrobacter sp. H14-L1]
MDDLDIESREVLNLAMIYDVVEFSTCLKPKLFLELLKDFSRVVYLDPDTFLIAPLLDLDTAVDQFGTVLTPHFLEAIRPGSEIVSEVHSLTVGVHNLGFGAFGVASRPFLEWWWSHLQRECLIYPLMSIFVDQKWTDVGAVLFDAHSLKHYGYNVGPWNLHERGFSVHDGVYIMDNSGEPLRLVHFSGFNPHDPDAISERLSISMRDAGGVTAAFRSLSREYAERVLDAQRAVAPVPAYGFATDTGGGYISKRLRKIYRKDLLSSGSQDALPSPFVVGEKTAFSNWKRRAAPRGLRITMSDLAIALKYALPDEFGALKRYLPRVSSRLRRQLLSAAEIRR